MINTTIALVGPIADAFKQLCQLFTTIWNGLVEGINVALGILLDPPGFLWWLIGQGILQLAKILPDVPDSMTLEAVANNIGQSTGIGVGLIKELIAIASQFLVIVAIIKIYKLIPFKAT